MERVHCKAVKSTCFAYLKHAGIEIVHPIGPPLQAAAPACRLSRHLHAEDQHCPNDESKFDCIMSSLDQPHRIIHVGHDATSPRGMFSTQDRLLSVRSKGISEIIPPANAR